jgi:hypothetical protein
MSEARVDENGVIEMFDVYVTWWVGSWVVLNVLSKSRRDGALIHIYVVKKVILMVGWS